MKRLLLFIFLLLASAVVAQAQAGRYDAIISDSNGNPLVGANAAVCTIGATIGTTSTPCSPLAIIYTSKTGTVQASNPYTTDSTGNAGFWASDGDYMLQVYGTAPLKMVRVHIFGTAPSTASAQYLYATDLKYGASFDASQACDAVFTNGSNQVTTGYGGVTNSETPAFTTAVSGNFVFGSTFQCHNQQPGTTIVMALGYARYVSANTINVCTNQTGTCTPQNAIANCSNGCALWWGPHDDTAALNAWFVDLTTPPCGKRGVVPGGKIALISGGIINNSATNACTGANTFGATSDYTLGAGVSWSIEGGTATSPTLLVILPTFDATGTYPCASGNPKPCIFGLYYAAAPGGNSIRGVLVNGGQSQNLYPHATNTTGMGVGPDGMLEASGVINAGFAYGGALQGNGGTPTFVKQAVFQCAGTVANALIMGSAATYGYSLTVDNSGFLCGYPFVGQNGGGFTSRNSEFGATTVGCNPCISLGNSFVWNSYQDLVSLSSGSNAVSFTGTGGILNIHGGNWSNGANNSFLFALNSTTKVNAFSGASLIASGTTAALFNAPAGSGITDDGTVSYSQTGASTLSGSFTTPASILNATGTPTCSTNCGTSPTVSGTNNSMLVTIGTSPPAAPSFTVTFAAPTGNNPWLTAPSCMAYLNDPTNTTPYTQAVGTTTTTVKVTLNANLVAGRVYSLICRGAP